MAHAWFDIIEKKDKKQMQQLKDDMAGKSLVGEYCGNPDYQHLVKYAEVTIFFYAVVENNSEYSCIPPPEAFKLFEQHTIPIVKNYK